MLKLLIYHDWRKKKTENGGQKVLNNTESNVP